MYQEKEIFSRNELLIGSKAMDKISKAHVILFGVGGVGSWCAESLIRSGIGHLTIVDPDDVSITNINRQLPATTETVGQAKVNVLKTRLLAINPHADITAVQTIYTNDTNDLFRLDTYDYILDAIDSPEHKTNLIINATRTNATFFSSMGAALKLDASHIHTAEFWKVYGCPLAAALRRRLKKNTMPAKKFLCVFSDEVPENKGIPPIPSPGQSIRDERKARINGTIPHITAIFGFTLAGLLIQDIVHSSSLP
ncbi:MAG: tRNA threonylcarbamoyladenosine dehydratase [Tannerella sp.]|jgi:tRNA A37 threonylcarbamoyladenosine dehydratase|nr:tRNA threonylcarbamoyladenosine dehydratase [Tannerella sp.]